MRRIVVAVVAVVMLAGCTSDPAPDDGVNPSDVVVDSPKLRAQKAEAGIEPCESGPGGGPLPVLTLPCLGGGPDVDLSSLAGPLVVNLWNSPCTPCRKEMPVLQQFHERYGDRVTLVGIDLTDTSPGAAIALAQATGATYPQLADPGGELFEQELRIAAGVPQFVMVDEDGEVSQAVGGLESVEDVVEMVETHMGITL